MSISFETQDLRVLGIVQARMGSSRLPGKVLAQICGVPMLVLQMERLARSKLVDEWVVATSTQSWDDILEVTLKQNGINVYRGSESDVLGRFEGCANEYGADVIVRMTGDCPLSDPELVDEAVTFFSGHAADTDYVAINHNSYPHGLDCEVFWRKNLAYAHETETLDRYREHVTPFMNQHPDKYRLKYLQSDDPRPGYRWCVDEIDDFRVVKIIFDVLYPQNKNFTWRDACALVDATPELAALNEHVTQKQFQKKGA